MRIALRPGDELLFGRSSEINMAQQQDQQLRQLIQSVQVLTDQMSQPSTSNVNAEVSRVFGRSQGNPTSRSSLNGFC